jgi:HEAT repeat protein
MRRILMTAGAVALLASPGLMSAAFAHGGSYRGPAGEVPPDSREPSDPPPPPEGGGPQTPGGENPGGPTTGGPEGGGPGGGGGTGGAPPTSGGSGGGPQSGGGGGGGPTTGGAGRPKAQSKGAGYEDWTFWWNYNKDEILQLKSAVKRMQKGPMTGPMGKKGGSAAPIRSATEEAIQQKIVPVLRQLLDGKDISFHIQSAAELGLVKIGDESILETLKKMALNGTPAGGTGAASSGKTYHREVEESAALAFGLLQKDTAEIRSFLIDLVKDQKRDGTFTRPFAAISLGLLGSKNDKDNSALTALVEVVAHKESGQDVKPACLTAIGLLGNDAAVPELLAMVQTGKSQLKGSESLDETELAYAISALGKIGRAGLDGQGKEYAVLEEIIKIADSKDNKGDKIKHGTNERRSAAIALGQIGPSIKDAKVQKKTLEALKNLAKEAQDTQEKNFAIISLGRIGAANDVDEGMRKETIAVLKDLLDKEKGLTPPFAALALGLIGRQFAEEGKPAPEEDIRAPIREKFKTEKEAKSRGAYAVASGLVKDPLAIEALKTTLADKGMDKRLRGYCALGLGMIGAADALDTIKEALKDPDKDVRVQTAMAAGLMGDANVIDPIVEILKDKEASNYELGSAALALGQIGDERAIEELVRIAVDDKKVYADLTRALATVSLGQIGDRRDIPTLARVATDINYRAHAAAITELLTIL